KTNRTVHLGRGAPVYLPHRLAPCVCAHSGCSSKINVNQIVKMSTRLCGGNSCGGKTWGDPKIFRRGPSPPPPRAGVAIAVCFARTRNEKIIVTPMLPLRYLLSSLYLFYKGFSFIVS